MIFEKIKNKLNELYIAARVRLVGVRDAAFDTRGDGYIDVAVKVIIGVVIGALILGGIYLLWENVIMPRINTEVTNMFDHS